MTTNRTAIINARILTLAGAAEPRRNHELRELAVVDPGWIIIEHERIVAIGSGSQPESDHTISECIDATGCVVLPAFVDCHTHACWAGNRLDEFDQKLAGVDYLTILQSGGGIMSTVRNTRAATEEQLRDGLLDRLHQMSQLGTGTVEVKSGYGLDTETELKMLRAIAAAADRSALRIVPTFLGAHAVDPDNPTCIEGITHETLPAVATEFPGINVDAYCEQGAWSLNDCRTYFEQAQRLGSPIRVHADQFNSLGMTHLAVDMNARSVDHLEAATPSDLLHLAHSETIGVMLPVCGFHLDGRYAAARTFIDAGGALALASNYNPGSAPSPSLLFVMNLAVRNMGMTPHEAIMAVTFNAACVLDMQHEIGSLEVGKRADLQVYATRDERELAYDIAAPGPAVLMLDGRVMFNRMLA